MAMSWAKSKTTYIILALLAIGVLVWFAIARINRNPLVQSGIPHDLVQLSPEYDSAQYISGSESTQPVYARNTVEFTVARKFTLVNNDYFQYFSQHGWVVDIRTPDMLQMVARQPTT